MNPFDIRGRVAIVTGASSGLGARFAYVLHDAGAQVVLAARRRDRLEAVAADLPGVDVVTADVTDTGDRRRLVEGVLERHGRVDVLVNNAGGAVARPALSEPVEAFTAAYELNVVAGFALSQLVAPSMIAAGGGSIVNVSSVLGSVSAWPLATTGYTAAKGAVVQLTRELGCQWAADGVRVNALSPGWFPSESLDGDAADSIAGYVRRGCPMGRMGRPHELDGALLFLASDASSYMTGQTLTVDGGWTAH